MNVTWQGVIPAMTTPFGAEARVDEGFLREHARWLVEHGCTALVPLGSLGEAATLSPAEKRRVIEVCVHAVGARAPVIPGIAALGTEEAVALVARTKLFQLAESLGGVESLIEVPARMTHAATADAPFAAPPNLIRLSVGIESAEDLVADLEQALVPARTRA